MSQTELHCFRHDLIETIKETLNLKYEPFLFNLNEKEHAFLEVRKSLKSGPIGAFLVVLESSEIANSKMLCMSYLRFVISEWVPSGALFGGDLWPPWEAGSRVSWHAGWRCDQIWACRCSIAGVWCSIV
jgi:hypothetical protein